MAKKLKGRQFVLVYGSCLLVMALATWFILLSRNSILAVLTATYVQDKMSRAWQVRALDKFYTVAMGVVWLVLMIFSEYGFRRGALRGLLGMRLARILGVELLLIVIADFALLWVQGIGSGSWLRWILIGGGLVGGVYLSVFARTKAQQIKANRMRRSA